MSEDQTLKVLLVEDSPLDADVVRTVLDQAHTPRFAVDHVVRLDEALARVAEGDYDVVLLDLMLPDSSGVDTFTQLSAVAPNIPVVVLTASEDRALAASFLNLGIQDYLVKKEISPTVLCGVLAFAVKHKRMLTVLQGEYDQLNDLIAAVQDGKVDSIIGPGARSAVYHVESLELHEENQRLLRELSEANRIKDEFLAKMSHELRTPLNSIIGFTEMMIHDTKDRPAGKRVTRLEKVHRNAENLLALINDILDISKIEAKQLTLARQSVDVVALITECIESAEPLVRKGAIELRQHIDESLACRPNWTGDALRLQQIVVNLLGNAAKFTERGHVEVRGSVADGSLVIEVEDTGLGIPKEHLSCVFDDFHQVDSSSTRRAGGTGLGLAICKKLCQLMGGEITATSTPGIGSLFTIRLPIAEIPADADDAHQPPVLYAGTQVSVHRVRQFVQNLASHIGCVTEMRRAVEYCQQRAPGILYIDPSWHDALELLATLKRYDSTQRIPIGLLGVAADRAALVTFDDCVALSLGKDTLHRILRGTCDSPRSRVLLFLERRAGNQYLHDMLAEFPDIAAMTATSEREAEACIAGGEFDAVLVDVLDTRGEGLELVARHDRTRAPARPRLIAVTPRDPSSENILALSRAFELHIARRGEPVDQVLRRLYDEAGPREELRETECVAK